MTQSLKDVPADVLAQLGNRVQHALRAFTPDDAKALRAAARTFPTSDYDLERLLQELGTGEAVTTVLTEKGRPTPVAWTRLRAPRSSMDPAPAGVLDQVVAASPLAPRYAETVDNESAHELLAERMATAEQERAAAEAEAQRLEEEAAAAKAAEKEAARKAREKQKSSRRTSSASKGMESLLRSVGTQLGREITRTVFGTRRRYPKAPPLPPPADPSAPPPPSPPAEFGTAGRQVCVPNSVPSAEVAGWVGAGVGRCWVGCGQWGGRGTVGVAIAAAHQDDDPETAARSPRDRRRTTPGVVGDVVRGVG